VAKAFAPADECPPHAMPVEIAPRTELEQGILTRSQHKEQCMTTDHLVAALARGPLRELLGPREFPRLVVTWNPARAPPQVLTDLAAQLDRRKGNPAALHHPNNAVEHRSVERLLQNIDMGSEGREVLMKRQAAQQRKFENNCTTLAGGTVPLAFYDRQCQKEEIGRKCTMKNSVDAKYRCKFKHAIDGGPGGGALPLYQMDYMTGAWSAITHAPDAWRAQAASWCRARLTRKVGASPVSIKFLRETFVVETELPDDIRKALADGQSRESRYFKAALEPVIDSVEIEFLAQAIRNWLRHRLSRKIICK